MAEAINDESHVSVVPPQEYIPFLALAAAWRHLLNIEHFDPIDYLHGGQVEVIAPKTMLAARQKAAKE